MRLGACGCLASSLASTLLNAERGRGIRVLSCVQYTTAAFLRLIGAFFPRHRSVPRAGAQTTAVYVERGAGDCTGPLRRRGGNEDGRWCAQRALRGGHHRQGRNARRWKDYGRHPPYVGPVWCGALRNDGGVAAVDRRGEQHTRVHQQVKCGPAAWVRDTFPPDHAARPTTGIP